MPVLKCSSPRSVFANAHAALRLQLLHVKTLALNNNAKEDRFAESLLQPIKIRPGFSKKTQSVDGSPPNLVNPQAKPVSSRFWILYHQPVLLQHHHQAV